MIVIGIDIGITGALAGLDGRGTSSIVDIPTKPEGKTRRIDGRGLLNAVRAMVPAGEKGLAVIEDVQARPFGNHNAHGNSMHSQGSLMGSRRAVEAVLDIAGIEIAVVSPQTWKAFYGLTGQGKADAMALAQRFYPDAPLKLVKHHNRGEALLLARYGQRKLVEIEPAA